MEGVPGNERDTAGRSGIDEPKKCGVGHITRQLAAGEERNAGPLLGAVHQYRRCLERGHGRQQTLARHDIPRDNQDEVSYSGVAILKFGETDPP